jgi:hypothetical protein
MSMNLHGSVGESRSDLTKDDRARGGWEGYVYDCN